MIKERDEFVDVAKGICMLLVIGIHTEAYVSIGMPLTFVAVPMFFFMSGFYDRSGFSILLKSLLWPAFVWLVIGAVFQYFLILLGGEEDLSFDFYNPAKYNGPVWFLFALFYAKIVMKGLHKICSEKYVLISISILLGYIGSTNQMPLLIDEGLAALPFYCIGKYCYPHLNTYINSSLIALLGVISIAFFTYGYLFYIINPTVTCCYNHFYLIPLVGVLLAFAPFLYASTWFAASSVLRKIGKNTLGILVIHLPLCMIMARIAWRIYDRGTIEWYLLSFAFYILIVIVSYYLTTLTSRFCPILFRIGNK